MQGAIAEPEPVRQDRNVITADDGDFSIAQAFSRLLQNLLFF